MGTPHNAQTPKDGLPRCKQRELRAYLVGVTRSEDSHGSRDHGAWHTSAASRGRAFDPDATGTDGAVCPAMLTPLTCYARALLAASALCVVVVSGGGCSSSSSASSACVDFAVTSADLTCTVSTDCTFIGALTVCPGAPSCGDETPVNSAAAARYDKAVSGVPTRQVECGAPSPVGCVNKQCVIVTPGDAG